MALGELADRGRDAIDLLVGELWIHGNREHLVREALGEGQVALAVPEELRRLLEVDRYRIVDLRPDAAVGEESPQRVAAATRHADAVHVEDVPLARWQ